MLGSGHFVLYRKVWRDGERYIQGFVIDQTAFLQETIGSHFVGTALSGMANLNVAYEGVMLSVFNGDSAYRYSSASAGLDGELLYRNRLTAPLDSLELIFQYQSSTGRRRCWRARLGHSRSAMLVFLGGFTAVYRVGLSQINLAQPAAGFCRICQS